MAYYRRGVNCLDRLQMRHVHIHHHNHKHTVWYARNAFFAKHDATIRRAIVFMIVGGIAFSVLMNGMWHTMNRPAETVPDINICMLRGYDLSTCITVHRATTGDFTY